MGRSTDYRPNPPPPQPQLQLVVHAGPLAGKGFPITGNELTFGRDPDNDLPLDDTQVSRYHARLYREDDQVILEDLGSMNGTLVNGRPITGRHVLQPADIISMGSSVFGVKGFSAPLTVGVTQLSTEKPTFLTYTPAAGGIEAKPAPPTRRPAAAARSGPLPAKKSGGFNLFMIGAIAALVIIILLGAAATAYFMVRGNGAAVADIPVVVITAPVSGSQVRVNEPVTVQTTASDPAGVTRVELWVSGLKADQTASPAAQGQATFTTSFQWTPQAPGSYTVEIRAYNARGGLNTPTMVTVNAAGEAVATGTPTDTPTPGTPTATVPANPGLTTQTDLNVRAGPSLEYDLLGLLPFGVSAEIIGRSEDGQWWQIRFAPAANGLGWVSADPAFANTFKTESVPVIPAPPLPTPTPTLTPTSTQTATPAPPTATPTLAPTPTATGEPVVFQLNVSPTTIEGGQCVNITWTISGVKAIYYEGNGVTGTGNEVDCPKDTKTYEVRIVLKDDTERIEKRTVEVVNPVSSFGTIKVEANQTVDFDRGSVPGDDFIWSIEGGLRKFEVQGLVKLAPKRDLGNLKDLKLAECAGADFGPYTFIDGSDVVIDPANELIPGRSACFKTSEGRLGKLRFPDVSTGSLRVEWLTWK